MSYSILNLSPQFIDKFLNIIDNSYYPYSEYSSIANIALKNNFRELLLNGILKKNCISKSIEKNGHPKGLLVFQKNDFDSEIFGFNVFKITQAVICANEQQEQKEIIAVFLKIINSVRIGESIKYLHIALNTNHTITNILMNDLISSGFYLINTLLTFSLSKKDKQTIKSKSLNRNPEIIIRLANSQDCDEICTIAKTSFKINRFHLDPNLDNKKCDSLHEISARNSLLHNFANVVFVAEFKNEIIGYYSGKVTYNSRLESNIGEAIISAVRQDYRGKGVFSMLNNSLIDWFMLNSDFSEMGTYINNSSVHRTWIGLGLPIIRGSYQLAIHYK